jgi:hypothetical protein
VYFIDWSIAEANRSTISIEWNHDRDSFLARSTKKNKKNLQNAQQQREQLANTKPVALRMTLVWFSRETGTNGQWQLFVS